MSLLNEHRIMIVGDLHGNWSRLNQLISSKKPKIVLQCGDFGWWPAMEVIKPVVYGQQKEWRLKGIKNNEVDVYFCDGNHEQHPVLSQNGSMVELYPGVFHCQRGSVLVLPDGRNVMFMGGAYSVDKGMRTPGHDWFHQENINQIELDYALEYEGKVDIVISHTCPSHFKIKGNEDKNIDGNRHALGQILERHKPDKWYFGHWHTNKLGKFKNTEWECLDYPGHVSKWWTWL